MTMAGPIEHSAPMGEGGGEREGPPRIELLAPADMDEDQRRFYEAVQAGPRGQLVGPLRAAIHSPPLARLWSDFGEHLRYRTSLEPRLVELAILVAARRWTSQVEWWVHAPLALRAGVSEVIVDAILLGEPPPFADPAEAEVYEFARILAEQGAVPDAVYDPVKRRFGTVGVVELTAVVGYYTMVAMTLNAHRMPTPDGASPLAAARGRLAPAPAARAG